MKAIIPAAGYATRMYPLTENKPKGLLPVANKPMIEHVISKILGIEDVDEIFVVTNEKFYSQFLEWSKSFECKVPVKILNDGTTSNGDRLGSIGDINFVLEHAKIDDDIIIVNSDNLFTFNLAKIAAFFKEKKTPVIAMYDTRDLGQACKMGAPETNETGKVTGFVEKPPEPTSTLCSIGIYLYPKDVVPMFRQYIDEGNSADKTGEFVAWLFKRKETFGFSFDAAEDKWFDIGDLEMYEAVKEGFGGD